MKKNILSAVVLTLVLFAMPSVGSADGDGSSGAMPAKLVPSNMPAEAPTTITADIVDPTGKKIGEVKAKQDKVGVKFSVNVTGLKPGMHGIHIHAAGKCDGPDFKSAAGHFATGAQHHGMKNPQGPHMGDLANLIVKKDGSAHQTFVDKAVTLQPGLNSLMKDGGTALVIHADMDDEKSDPAGNAGARIACAVLSK
jgi:Cu-Zn family superoxide dismutase